MSAGAAFDPSLDLSLERNVDVPPELVWQAWTDPDQLVQWYAPRPWRTVECDVDLQPGGLFRTVLRSPEGQDFEYLGCYLEVHPGKRLVWTTLLRECYRPLAPATSDVPPFTADISFVPQGRSTRYVATIRHADTASRARHEARGFYQGWATAADQMVQACLALNGRRGQEPGE